MQLQVSRLTDGLNIGSESLFNNKKNNVSSEYFFTWNIIETPKFDQ